MKTLQDTWIKLSTKLDAMTLRERALVFVAATGLILFLLYTMAVEPMLARQKMLLAQIGQQQTQVGVIDAEIAARAQGFVVDPDAPARIRLASARGEVDRIGANLLAVQKGLVAPEKIAPLLEQLLRSNGKLKLVSLRTLAVTGMNEASAAPVASDAGVAAGAAVAGGAAGAAGPAAGERTAPMPSATVGATTRPRELLYRHGVEVVLQGGYLDMISYMQALEALPAQLFWGGARLDAREYPEARLTLTLYTLSLDEKWMTL